VKGEKEKREEKERDPVAVYGGGSRYSAGSPGRERRKRNDVQRKSIQRSVNPGGIGSTTYRERQLQRKREVEMGTQPERGTSRTESAPRPSAERAGRKGEKNVQREKEIQKVERERAERCRECSAEGIQKVAERKTQNLCRKEERGRQAGALQQQRPKRRQERPECSVQCSREEEIQRNLEICSRKRRNPETHLQQEKRRGTQKAEKRCAVKAVRDPESGRGGRNEKR